jgi:hypothetical protein
MKMRAKNTRVEARALAFHSVCMSRSPTLALELTGDFDKEERHAGRSDGAGTTLRRGLRDATVGLTSDYARKFFR